MSASAADLQPGRRIRAGVGRQHGASVIVGAFALVALMAAFYVVLELGVSTLVKVGLIAVLVWLTISIVAVAMCAVCSRDQRAEQRTSGRHGGSGQRAPANDGRALRGASVWRSG